MSNSFNPDERKHVWFYAGELTYLQNGEVTVSRINTPIFTDKSKLNSRHLLEASKNLATVLVCGKEGVKQEDILDIFCLSVSYLGVQSWNEFRGNEKGTELSKEDMELDNVTPTSLDYEVAKYFNKKS